MLLGKRNAFTKKISWENLLIIPAFQSCFNIKNIVFFVGCVWNYVQSKNSEEFKAIITTCHSWIQGKCILNDEAHSSSTIYQRYTGERLMDRLGQSKAYGLFFFFWYSNNTLFTTYKSINLLRKEGQIGTSREKAVLDVDSIICQSVIQS